VKKALKSQAGGRFVAHDRPRASSPGGSSVRRMERASGMPQVALVQDLVIPSPSASSTGAHVQGDGGSLTIAATGLPPASR
jgi:hypothetical protein